MNFRDKPSLLLQLANTEAGRHLLGKLGKKVEYPIVKITKNSYFEKIDKKHVRARFFSRAPIEKIFSPILTQIDIANEYKPIENKYDAFLHYSGLELKTNKYPFIFLDTFNPASGSSSPVDGRAQRSGVDQTLANIRSGAGVSALDNAGIEAITIASSTSTNQYATLVRMFWLFDTSSIPDSATISSATLSLYGQGKSNGLGSPGLDIVSGAPASTSTIAASDYLNIGTTVYSTISYASYSTSGYNDLSLDSNGIANITKTGVSKFAGTLTWDTSGSFGGSWISLSQSNINMYMADNGSNVPVLTVVYPLSNTTGSFLLNFIM